MLEFGVDPGHLHGVDLLVERVSAARERLPHLPLVCASGARLPYSAGTFDVVLQFTVFSSILDRSLCYTVARELLRVLSPGGCILWYDFWINPVNRQTRGISPAEIRKYFPSSRISFKRITLAPPIARRIVPLSWSSATFLEKLSFLNTHYLAAIRPMS
jgi:ubiquinone/menaquinone biosynthesis C-methylase UbiE